MKLTQTPENLEKLMQSLALLDAILCENWENRYYSFNTKWNEETKERMGSMRDGSGDHYYCLFTHDGAILKGFAHEKELANYTLDAQVKADFYAQIPKEFQDFVSEPAFETADFTFCTWRLNTDNAWHSAKLENNSDDGSDYLLRHLDGDPAKYVEFAAEYFEKKISIEVVKNIYAHKTLTAELVKTVDPERDYKSVLSEVSDEIGYPTAK